MAVVSVGEMIGAREKSTRDNGDREYRRKFRVICDSQQDDGHVVASNINIPQRWTPYTTPTHFDQKALCRSVTARQTSDARIWEVECTYSTAQTQEEEDEQDDPLQEPPDISVSFETMQVPIIGTTSSSVVSTTAPGVKFIGRIGNTLGVIYDPPPMDDESRPIVTIARNEPSFNMLRAIDYQDAVNSDAFFGAEPRQIKMRSITGEFQVSKGTAYWRITYVLAFKRETWDKRLLNQGPFYSKVANSTASSDYVAFEEGGRPYWGALKEDGTKVTADTDAYYRQYRCKKELPFAALNLPLGPNR